MARFSTRQWNPGRRFSGRQQVGIRWLRHIAVDGKALGEAMAKEAAKMIRKRTEAGVGSRGQVLDTDLEETGEMLRSIKRRKVIVAPGSVTAHVGPNTRMRRSGITNAKLARIIHFGHRHRRARPFMALTQDQLHEFLAKLSRESSRFVVSKPGAPTS